MAGGRRGWKRWGRRVEGLRRGARVHLLGRKSAVGIRHEILGTWHTVFGNVILGFGNTPVARGWSFYRRCRGLGRGIGGAWGGIRLRLLLLLLLLLLLFAAAEEAAEDSFHLG